MRRRAWPVRTCVGCRERAPVFNLLRVVAAGNGEGHRLLPDPARRLSGRGAHLHPDPACLALAERRRAFGRALRLTGIIDTGPLAEHLRGASRRAEPPTVAVDAPPETSKVGRPT